MLLKLKKKDSDPIDPKDLAVRLEESELKREFFLLSIRTLLQCIRDFALDLDEINSDGFKSDIINLSDKFSAESKLKRIQSYFEREKGGIDAFINLQKKYLFDRESEFKDIIDILTKAMVSIDTENQEYNEKILAQGERIEKITLLDDIKKIKQAMIQEIEQMRAIVEEKQIHDCKKLEILAKQVDTLNVQLNEARKESVTDGLTGVNNRKSFDRYISELVEKNTVSNRPFSLLMLDIDNFKQVNDNYGHQTGDRVILAVIGKCRQSIRGEDFLARYGGEEFVVILPGASLKNAVKKAKHICQTIATTRYSLDDVQGNPTLSVTVSIGVAAYQKADTRASVVERADKALYLAKQSGKNRVISEKDL
jgi:diguanylate cyclase